MVEPSAFDPPPVFSADEKPAWRDLNSYLRLIILGVAGLALDLWSKSWAFHTLGQGGDPWVIIPNVLEFHTMFNSGALFGIAQGQTLFFICASILALGLVFWMFAGSPARRWGFHLALGAILAGALGNMYDRINVRLVQLRNPTGAVRYYEVIGDQAESLVLKEYPADRPGSSTRMLSGLARERAENPVGYVRDFIKIPTRFMGGREIWPWVFNIADALLVCGVATLGLYLWRDRRRRPPGDRDDEGGGTPADAQEAPGSETALVAGRPALESAEYGERQPV